MPDKMAPMKYKITGLQLFKETEVISSSPNKKTLLVKRSDVCGVTKHEAEFLDGRFGLLVLFDLIVLWNELL